MESLIHADIFFFVTSAVVIVVGVFLGVAILYTVTILHDLKKISRKFRQEGENLLDDIHDWRLHIFRKWFKRRKH